MKIYAYGRISMDLLNNNGSQVPESSETFRIPIWAVAVEECQGSTHKNCDMFENMLNTPSLLLCSPLPPMFGDSWYQPTVSTWQLACALVSDNPLAIALEIPFHVRSDAC